MSSRSALDRIIRIINITGPRLCGSEPCESCATMLYDEMKTIADKAEIEDFKVHPDAFLGWVRPMVASYITGLCLLWAGWPIPALVFCSFMLICMVFEFVFYYHVMDPFFKEATGHNVYGIIEPEGEVKQTFIFSGHHDSAHIFNFYVQTPKWYGERVLLGFGTFLFFLLALILSLFHTTPKLVLIVFTIGSVFTLPLWNFASDQGTPGAGDNLIASSMGIELLKYFKEHRPKNTRILCVSYDGEECGLRGSHAFYAKHKELLTCPTYNLNVDCAYYVDFMFFVISDINGTVNLSKELALELQGIAQKLGFNPWLEKMRMMYGGTDAAEAAKVGIKTITLAAIPWDNKVKQTVYHTPNDTPESIEPEMVEATMNIATAFVCNLDTVN